MNPTILTQMLPTLLMAAASILPLRAQEDSLSHYLSLAVANNPSIAAARLNAEASLQKLPQAGAYADPTLEAGIFLSPMEQVEGRQVAQIQAMQMFPWFGVRKAARTEARHMSNMAYAQLRETQDNILLEVYTQWYALCALRQRLAHSEANRRWMEQLERLAIRTFASGGAEREKAYTPAVRNAPAAPSTSPSGSGMDMGGGSATMQPAEGANAMPAMDDGMAPGMGGAPGLSDVLRLQLETMELDSRMESLRAAIRAETARFNALLNRPAETPVCLPDTLALVPFLPDTETILRHIDAQNPMLSMLREESLAYRARGEMERKMSYPMWGVGLQYMLMAPLRNAPADDMAGMSGGTPAMNGKDMLMPMLSISIPLYRNKYKAARKESLLLRQASEERQTDVANRLEAELRRSLYLLDDAARQADLYRRQANLAHAAGRLAIQEFASGKASLSDAIQIQRQLLDYQLKEAEAIAAYNTTVAAIRKLYHLTNNAYDNP
jgi:outer membrane protein TolC